MQIDLVVILMNHIIYSTLVTYVPFYSTLQPYLHHPQPTTCAIYREISPAVLPPLVHPIAAQHIAFTSRATRIRISYFDHRTIKLRNTYFRISNKFTLLLRQQLKNSYGGVHLKVVVELTIPRRTTKVAKISLGNTRLLKKCTTPQRPERSIRSETHERRCNGTRLCL